MAYESLSVSEVRAAVQQAGASWQADVTSVSELSAEEKRLRLGYVPGPNEPSLAQREQAAGARLKAEGALTAIGAPAAFDLRNVGGQNFITPVKDQGGCGSCVAFGVAATAEGTLRFQRNDPALTIDYSEAHLFYCHARSQGRTCLDPVTGGWWVPPALDCMKNPGVADEACYPYTAGDQNCTHLCADWQGRVKKITAWHQISTTAEMKTWLSTKGPLAACFTVYSDFYAYSSGIYHHVTGGVEGGHCVSCVGYNDAGGYWICKNSWGPGWGESGFFRIAYGDCGIDAAMWAVDSVEETGWLDNRRVLGLWTINEDRNAYVFLDTVGWRKIATDNDNIFFNLLIELAAAKAGNRAVNVYQQQGLIKQVYVF